MTTAREYLDRYNVAATKLGRPTIKSWKSSTAAIQVKCTDIEAEARAFEATQEELAAQQTRQEVIADRMTIDKETGANVVEQSAEQKASAEAMRKAATEAAKKTIKRSKTATKAAKAGFSAAKIIAEFGVAPKIGRALLRKHNVKKTPDAIRAFFKSRAK